MCEIPMRGALDKQCQRRLKNLFQNDIIKTKPVIILNLILTNSVWITFNIPCLCNLFQISKRLLISALRFTAIGMMKDVACIRCIILKHERDRHVELIYFNGHYAWVKNFLRLLNCKSKNGHKFYYCRNCITISHVESEIARHKQLCTQENWCSVVHVVPAPGFVIEFKNFKFQTPAPFVIYIYISIVSLFWSQSSNVMEIRRSIKDTNALQQQLFWRLIFWSSTINGSYTSVKMRSSNYSYNRTISIE